MYEDVDMVEADCDAPAPSAATWIQDSQPIRASMHVDRTRFADLLLVADTNVYLDGLPILKRFKECLGPGCDAVADMSVNLRVFLIVPQAVLRELDRLKVDERIRQEHKLMAVRSAINMLNEHDASGFLHVQSPHDDFEAQQQFSFLTCSDRQNDDDRVLMCCLQLQSRLQAVHQENCTRQAVLLSNDSLLRAKSRSVGVTAFGSDALSPRDATQLYRQLHVPADTGRMTPVPQVNRDTQQPASHQLRPVQPPTQQLPKQDSPNAGPAATRGDTLTPARCHCPGTAPAAPADSCGSEAWQGAASEALRILLDSLQPAMGAVLSHALGEEVWAECLDPRPPWREPLDMVTALASTRDCLGLSHTDANDFLGSASTLRKLASQLRRQRSKDRDPAFVLSVLEACCTMLSVGRRCLQAKAAELDWPRHIDSEGMQEQLAADDQHMQQLARLARPQMDAASS